MLVRDYVDYSNSLYNITRATNMRWDYAHEIYNFVKILTPKIFSPIIPQSLQIKLSENIDPQKFFFQSSPNWHTLPLRYHDACSRTWETVYLPNTYFALLFLHWTFFDVIPCTLCLCHCLVSPLNTCFNFFVVLCRRGCWWCTGCILLY